MAGERTLPGVGLTGFWDLGDNTWKTGMDDNLRMLSAVVQAAVLSIEAAEPVGAVDGDIYLASSAWGGGLADDIMVRDAGAWVSITPTPGWQVYDEATDAAYIYDGTGWVPRGSVPPLSNHAGEVLTVNATADGAEWSNPNIPTIIEDTAADHPVTDADLKGGTVLKMNNAAANTVSVPAGLTGAAPLTIVQAGAGTTSIVVGVGVTVNSLNGSLALAGQYASATLVPDGPDTYLLVGALA